MKNHKHENDQCYHEEKYGKNYNELHNMKPDVDCTCDVGITGPALEIEEEVEKYNKMKAKQKALEGKTPATVEE